MARPVSERPLYYQLIKGDYFEVLSFDGAKQQARVIKWLRKEFINEILIMDLSQYKKPVIPGMKHGYVAYVKKYEGDLFLSPVFRERDEVVEYMRTVLEWGYEK